MPIGDGIVLKYGDYVFDPRPLFTYNKEILKTASNVALGTKYSMTLEGFILPDAIDPIGDNKGGLQKVFGAGSVGDVGLFALRNAFAQDFRPFGLQCGDDPPLVTGFPKVLSIDVRNASDNYIRRADYTINLEFPSITGSGYEAAGLICDGAVVDGTDLTEHGLLSLTDDVTVEFMDEKVGGAINMTDFPGIPSVFSVQRTISAVGDSMVCEAGEDYIKPVERAGIYVSGLLQGDDLGPGADGLRKLMCVNGLTLYNNFRSTAINEYEGSVNVTNSMIATTSGDPYTEEFEVSIERSEDSPLMAITLNGTIQGLTSIGYINDGVTDGCPPTGEPKFNNALAGWNTISGLLSVRAQSVYNSISASRVNPDGALNIYPLSESLGYNIVGGTITYSNSYNDRALNCHSGALTETITFTYNEPNDIFASLTVLGRSQGPLFQQIGTVGPRTRDVAIDAIIKPETGCADAAFNTPPTGYDFMVNNYEASLQASYSVVFTNSETKSWEPKAGHFTYNKSWTVGSC